MKKWKDISNSYKKSGVDIKKADKFVNSIKIVSNISGIYDNLVASCDGVGTKIKLLTKYDLYETIGIDLVAMNVNDILVLGGKPLFFLDYIAIGKLEEEKMMKIVGGIIKGCEKSGAKLIGGETAEMNIYGDDYLDVAGFAVGNIVKNMNEEINSGDIIVGIGSSGPHANGFSLIRKILEQKSDNFNIKEELLNPTNIYVKDILEKMNYIKKCVHITGGGIKNRVESLLKEDISAIIEIKHLDKEKIFEKIRKNGKLSLEDMYTTFNMGIGFIMIVPEQYCDNFSKEPYKIIGKIVKGNKEVIFI